MPLLAAGVDRLAAALAPYVFSDDGRALEVVVGDALRAHGWRIAVAESCTAGLVLGRLTDVPGSSAWVVGGVVAYANDVKVQQLGVPGALLQEHGAVSEPVAQAMASGCASGSAPTSASRSPASRVPTADRRRNRWARSSSRSAVRARS